jgi:hypothetical protein
LAAVAVVIVLSPLATVLRRRTAFGLPFVRTLVPVCPGRN